jgi:hypothetical protein
MARNDSPPLIGRPTDYDPKYVHLIRHLRKEGRDIAAFCSAVGISRKTYNNWKHKYPEFAEACETAAEDSKAWLGELLRKKAMGEGKDFDSSAITALYDRQHGSVRSSDEAVKTEINIGSMNILSQLSDEQLSKIASEKYKTLVDMGQIQRIPDGSDKS